MNRTTNAVDTGPLEVELVERYRHDGFLLLPPDFLNDDVLGAVSAVLPRVLSDRGPRVILERDAVTVRSVYGVHQNVPEIRDIARRPDMLGAVRQLLADDEVYVHQSKINLKAPLAGDQWEWHQDYIYWLRQDGIIRPDLVNVSVFLDDVTEFNGPLTFIPGSHRGGVLAATLSDGLPLGYEDAPEWVSTLTAEEKFQVGGSVIENLARANGMVSPKGLAGSVLFFNPNLLHASSPNLSPFRRAMLILVYNTISNAPVGVTQPRPDFLSEPDVHALQPVGHNNSGETSK